MGVSYETYQYQNQGLERSCPRIRISIGYRHALPLPLKGAGEDAGVRAGWGI